MSIYAALLGIPQLDGADCAGLWLLFDEPEKRDRDRDEVIDSALRLCELCLALADGRDWFDRLPFYEKPSGVIAGEFRPFIRQRSGAA